jgi:hypothetical protein
MTDYQVTFSDRNGYRTQDGWVEWEGAIYVQISIVSWFQLGACDRVSDWNWAVMACRGKSNGARVPPRQNLYPAGYVWRRWHGEGAAPAVIDAEFVPSTPSPLPLSRVTNMNLGENMGGGVMVENLGDNVTNVGGISFLNLEGDVQETNTILGGQIQLFHD